MLKFIVLLTLLPMFFTYAFAENYDDYSSGYYDQEDRGSSVDSASAGAKKSRFQKTDFASKLDSKLAELDSQNNLNNRDRDLRDFNSNSYVKKAEGKKYRRSKSFGKNLGANNKTIGLNKKSKPKKDYEIINGNKIKIVNYDDEPKSKAAEVVRKFDKPVKKIKKPLSEKCKKIQELITEQETSSESLAETSSGQANAGSVLLLLMLQAEADCG